MINSCIPRYMGSLIYPENPYILQMCIMDKRIIDIIGMKFGRLTVESYSHSSNRRTYWNCICECGNHTVVRGDLLKSGNTKSCGCITHEPRGKAHNRKDLTGMRFGEMEVLGYVGTKLKKSMWLCVCSCGRTSIVFGHNLLTGKTVNCTICGYKKTSAKMTGELNPHWDPTLTDEQRKDRIDRIDRVMDSPEYRKWRWTIFRRDDFTCQMCGKKISGTLEAHHIKSWKEYPESRYDIDNGVTLCEECHKKIHKSQAGL